MKNITADHLGEARSVTDRPGELNLTQLAWSVGGPFHSIPSVAEGTFREILFLLFLWI